MIHHFTRISRFRTENIQKSIFRFCQKNLEQTNRFPEGKRDNWERREHSIKSPLKSHSSQPHTPFHHDLKEVSFLTTSIPEHVTADKLLTTDMTSNGTALKIVPGKVYRGGITGRVSNRDGKEGTISGQI